MLNIIVSVEVVGTCLIGGGHFLNPRGVSCTGSTSAGGGQVRSLLQGVQMTEDGKQYWRCIYRYVVD